jgi:hypothetical protein
LGPIHDLEVLGQRHAVAKALGKPQLFEGLGVEPDLIQPDLARRDHVAHGVDGAGDRHK